MKLFKNEVGRPSNEKLEKRSIVKISIITGAIALLAVIIAVITILIGNNNANKLKGAASNTFRIIYDSNGGTGSMKEQIVEHGKISKLTKNTFTKNGKKFNGWIAKRIVNGSELFRGCKTSGTCTNSKASWIKASSIKSYFIYNDEEIVSKTAPVGEAVYMYAQWSGEKNGVVSNSTNSNNTNSVNQSATSNKKSGGFLNSLFSLITKTVEFFSKITIKKPVITTTSPKAEEEITTVKSTTKAGYANSNIIETKKINKNVCSFPFGSINCEKQTNESVKKIQEMLKTLGFYNASIDGKYNAATRQAVEKFQISENIGVNKNGEADGVVGYKELLALAKNEKIKAPYFILKYEKGKNGVDTTIYGTSTIEENNIKSIYQVILKGIGDKISDSKFKHKNGASHVGYYAQRKVSGTTYHYGCDSTKCNSGSWKSSKGSNFNYYIYEIEQTLVETGKNGETVIMTAFYCDPGEVYDRNTSSCVSQKKSNSSGNVSITRTSVSASKYNDSSINWEDFTKKLSTKNSDGQTYLDYIAYYSYKEANSSQRKNSGITIDPAIIIGIIAVESRGNPNAYNSSSGCYGLMQVLAKNTVCCKNDPNQLYKPKRNIEVGVDVYAGKLAEASKNVSSALCKYNGKSAPCDYANMVLKYADIARKLYTITY